ncbi:lambda-exonuclease family protein [Quisquiliibacterium transsilvanicum]|uniref:Putative phage-type endonuclease n=1 Tax=Quisquiliibacterium transsilvanicum TaxID=1549638 RepID=A0A7W8M8L1_9BURK|nr:YqaJ viral recombinase family protein [Quisquiliibacterium transsilvanicum]MBB5271903.1 putative phage-type endonuclease [Quisquiliibacterium transsilvanicum]
MMATIVKLLQGSPEWHAHRLAHRNASETPAVLGLSPYTTPLQLWQQRTGRVTVETTAAMAHGTATEPEARAMYETLTGNVMQPLVLVDGEYSASLDGITLDGDVIVEIKCPKSKTSSLLQEARAGRVPVHVYWQMQHQLLVSGARLAHLYVFDGKTGILIEQAAEPDCWETIRQGWEAFMAHVRDDTPPPLSERDVVLRTDPEWETAAREYMALKSAAEAVAGELEAAKQRLVALTTHTSEQGFGVTVSRYLKTGSVDYKKVPELAGVDLERYRGAARQEVRVTVMK